MARVTQAELQAWAEGTKFKIVLTDTNSNLLTQIEEEVLARVGSAYDTTTWVDETTTPKLVRVAIAKLFVAWAYRRQYSEDLGENDATYAVQLEANAETIISGIVDGSIDIPGEGNSPSGEPVFYPTDVSTASCPTWDDRSLGAEKFSMNMVF